MVLAIGPLDDAILVGTVVEGRLGRDGSVDRTVGNHRIRPGQRAVIGGEVADDGVRDIVTGAAEIR
jgi:hypothetical protein